MMVSKVVPCSTRVKNKSPAAIQITAEHIIRGCQEAERICPSKLKITDVSELAENRLSKRKEFEELVGRVGWNKSIWVKYARSEDSHKDFDRARSVWERALALHYRDYTIWLNYADMEMKNKFINRARNIWERAVTILPRVDQLWYKYILMEEMLGNISGARTIFERWMTWQPDHQAWLSYIKFNLRYNEVDRARVIFDRFVQCHPKVSVWIRYAKFEMKNGEIDRARNCYQRALDKLVVADEDAHHLFVAFADFEDKCKERPKFVTLENKYGDSEDAIVPKMRLHYQDRATQNGLDYDVWFDYIRLEESTGNMERIRKVFQKAIANVPPANEKRFWQRYIYVWIYYALYEELQAQDMDRARQVYTNCLNLIPHRKFSFAKIWLFAAQFEIRQLNLKAARLILGSAIGKAPKHKIFNKYIQIELQLGNIDRCRKLYEKYLEWSPESSYAWRKYAELETSLTETERARAIFELAVAQPALDMPELLWKEYIDFEISNCEFERTRLLYERLLDRTKHLKAWISYAKFEASAMCDDDQAPDLADDAGESLLQQKKQCLRRARSVFDRGINYFRTSTPEIKVEGDVLLEEWTNLEISFGELGDVKLVHFEPPKKLKILESAYKWKKQKIASDEASDGFSFPGDKWQNSLTRQTVSMTSMQLETLVDLLGMAGRRTCLSMMVWCCLLSCFFPILHFHCVSGLYVEGKAEGIAFRRLPLILYKLKMH